MTNNRLLWNSTSKASQPLLSITCVHADKLVQYLMFILEMIKGSNYFDVHCLDSLNFNFFKVDDQLLIDDWVKSS